MCPREFLARRGWRRARCFHPALERLEDRLTLANPRRFAVIGDFGTASQAEADVAALVRS